MRLSSISGVVPAAGDINDWAGAFTDNKMAAQAISRIAVGRERKCLSIRVIGMSGLQFNWPQFQQPDNSVQPVLVVTSITGHTSLTPVDARELVQLVLPARNRVKTLSIPR
jgi:hypothetical protein